MTERELFEALTSSGLKLKGRGRPKKGSTDVTYAQLGLNRQQVHEWRLLASIPKEQFEQYMSTHQGKRISRRGILVHFGLRKNVGGDDNIPPGLLSIVDGAMAGLEQLALFMSPRDRRRLWQAVRRQIRVIDLKAELFDYDEFLARITDQGKEQHENT